MKINTVDVETSGTSFIGIITIPYKELKAKLGNPILGSGDGKVQAEWDIEHTRTDGEKVVATIYDWKESIPKSKVTEWHIGGHDEKAISVIKQLFPSSQIRKGY